jgi:hypothetical protein
MSVFGADLSALGLPVQAGMHYRHVTTAEIRLGDATESYLEVSISGGISVSGVEIGGEWSSRDEGLGISVGWGDAEVQVSPNSVQAMYDYGPGSVGLQADMPYGSAFLTTRGYLNDRGGPDAFGRIHVGAEAQLRESYYWSGGLGSNGEWKSGYSYANRLFFMWGWDNVQRVPGSASGSGSTSNPHPPYWRLSAERGPRQSRGEC